MGSEQIESRLTRRSFVQATLAGAAAVSLPARAMARSASRASRADAGRLFAQLDAKIEAGMAAYGIPGLAVGVLYGGREYLKGYGVTNVDYPRIPQLTPLGRVFFYNNPALCVAGRLIEVATGATYENAVRSLLIDPLGLDHSRFFSDEIIGFNIAASHKLVDGKPVVDPSFWEVPRSLNPTGGVISSVRDQLAYARFHLSDGRAPDGKRLLTPRSLERMRSHPGPGGTLLVELDGIGVSWMLRPSRQHVRIIQHGGDWPGQRSGFMMVPEQGFALTALTNSDGGIPLIAELFYDDWALRTFTGLSNLRAVPRVLSRRELAPYEGRYEDEYIATDGTVGKNVYELRGHRGGLRSTPVVGEMPVLDPESAAKEPDHVFYRKDYVLALKDGRPTGPRANFVRDGHGRVKWLRSAGRLYRHQL